MRSRLQEAERIASIVSGCSAATCEGGCRLSGGAVHENNTAQQVQLVLQRGCERIQTLPLLPTLLPAGGIHWQLTCKQSQHGCGYNAFSSD
jgi:hypothetical protein